MTNVHQVSVAEATGESPAVLRGPARHRTVGASTLQVFPFALSGNVFGWTADDAQTDAILDAYRGFGGNFVDTADSYSSGRSETMIGNWMRRRRNRADMIVATKVGKSADNPGLRARVLTRAVEASLTRLGTDCIDLLYLHIDDTTVEFEETLLAVDELIRKGKVRYFGGSDHTGNRLIEARVASAQLGVAPMVALQNHYNLVHRDEYEGDLAHVAYQQGLGVMPRFALASGFLTGKYRSRADVAQSDRRGEVARLLGRRGLRVLAALDSVAEEQSAKPGAIALAWLLTKQNVVAPVVSVRDAEQLADLEPAPLIRLTRHQVAVLDRASA
ncbi:aryl-alcohol dehydrogenase-like predicted oxidoreductase [Microbacteriaceae bacterium SG_E_30_P1]|uniref:Aryl-alcohol dehydrogenase-like predicted oxidoreductase n=1 Tax=Antiquaquibacter oligotrophicus TaxID=2880260 RepID=A0ABT6KLP8_9MICO|nr:aldo/keto reductase [Antiquaquibacter oligotrophicus]MDH6180671.1 aryl-alcohol dehydrogenase-like predicted oxidoreductase [Antiquaquibacter oligotrophicus]UDF13601.1 aldo/keto reductase [Antiquaquibacter oligotrophicus]